ncbi:hypothetical protein BaRGS_00008721, partial [Batillaria attramentaria]
MATEKNLAAVAVKKGELQLIVKSVPEPGPGEVLLSMRQVGICGSDVKFLYVGAIGPYVVRYPFLLGHECSGVVAKLGKGVTHLKVGDRVALEPGVVCGRCEDCKSGRYNLCPHITFLATPPDDGALARYHVLPDNVSFEEGACIEPLSVGLHSCRRANVTLGKKVLVCGAGPVGLCALVMAKALGASKLIITDLVESRLELAKKMGATHTLKIESSDPEAVAQQVREQLGAMPECAVECSGAQFSVHMAILVPLCEVVVREIEVRGSLRYMHTWPACIEMLRTGKVDIKPMITHYFTLEQAAEAFEFAKSGRG